MSYRVIDRLNNGGWKKNMLSVVVLGFTLESLSAFPDIAWAHHDSSTASDLSNREYALIIEKVVLQADALLVNLDVEKLTPTEVVILHHAYMQNKPIMGVGLRVWEPVIEEMLSKRMNDLNRAVAHIRTYYTLFSGAPDISPVLKR
ncbi:hypothetical protein P5G61_11000 [Paenibacillus sp. F6_3S_P_1C]|uniref:Uncharacterized protein n=1 Tax=Paenibacillus vandeheii TaxID=3035917 RepID=A0ABT8J9I9_9BACL|nr:hypothetical protein [Paenibacillus vandeheii]MDN4601752.1 hypothetical protein [Paenibacillus vandeheii]